MVIGRPKRESEKSWIQKKQTGVIAGQVERKKDGPLRTGVPAQGTPSCRKVELPMGKKHEHPPVGEGISQGKKKIGAFTCGE